MGSCPDTDIDLFFLGHKLQLCVSHNILWVTELSKPAMILVKN